MKSDIQSILLNAEQIDSRNLEIAREIDQYYENRSHEILLITLLDGAIVFTADLIRNLEIPLRLDCMRVSSYEIPMNPETAPNSKFLKSDVQKKHVLLVDDILDTGNTMSKVCTEISARKPLSIKTCVFG